MKIPAISPRFGMVSEIERPLQALFKVHVMRKRFCIHGKIFAAKMAVPGSNPCHTQHTRFLGGCCRTTIIVGK